MVLPKRNRKMRCNFIQPVFWIAALFVFFLAHDVSAHSNHVVAEKVERTSHSSMQVQVSVRSDSLPQKASEIDPLLNQEHKPYCCHTDNTGVACSPGFVSSFAKDILLIRLNRGTKIKLTHTSLQLGVTRAAPFRPPIL
jgi:hypothetical protein